MTSTPPNERLAVPVSPTSVCLPAGSFMVEDADEEIFLLLTGKQRGKESDDGLGFATTTKSSETIPISITVQEREWEGHGLGSQVGRGAKSKRRPPRKEVTVDLELHQDLDALRNRAGDTGSVLWRITLHLAHFLLSQNHFPPPTPLFPNWKTSTILELGSGTGALGLFVGSTVKSWIFSDQLSSLPLLVKNRRSNPTAGPPLSSEVREVDWIFVAADATRRANSLRKVDDEEPAPDIIIAADCIFNPFLSAPLARTINALAGPRTVALVASELRDPEPLELFLREWLDLGWKVARVVLGPEDEGGLGRPNFVMASSSSSPTSAGSSALNMLEFFHTIEKLKTEKRTGWVNHGVDKPESIADHMYRMAMMAMVLPPDAGVDISKVMMLALVHDMAEADVGDITPEHVSGVTKEDKLALEEKAMERIGGLLGHPSIPSLRIRSLWEEYEARETPESKVCKDLDLFELCVQAVEYENSQKIRTLQEFFATTVSRILHPTIKVWAHELMLKRKEAWEERGWTEYVHLDVAPDPTTDVVSPRAAPIPQHVYGEHAASLDEQ